jgi:hypothetical protein
MLQLLVVNSPGGRGKQICHPRSHTSHSDNACIVGPKPELKLSGLGSAFTVILVASLRRLDLTAG